MMEKITFYSKILLVKGMVSILYEKFYRRILLCNFSLTMIKLIDYNHNLFMKCTIY